MNMEEKTIIQADYDKLMNVIIDGMTKHNKKEILGRLLTQEKITLHDLMTKEIVEESIRFHCQQTAFNILVEIKKHFGSQLEIKEEDVTIFEQYNK